MISSRLKVVAFAAIALTMSAPAVNAQTASPPPAGPALPGVCVLSKDKVFYGSAVGKSVAARLQQLKAQADAELGTEGSTLEADAKALTAQRATLPPEQFEQRGTAINQRAAALQRKAQLRQRELAATQEKQLSRIAAVADPIVRQVFVQRSCSVLLDAASLIYPAPAMDVTDTVIRDLDARIQPVAFDREHLDAGAAPAQ